MNDALEYKALLTRLCAGETLSDVEMQQMMQGILSGEWTPVQTAAALVALKIKGEQPGEIAAAAKVMRRLSMPVTAAEGAIDTCGTGGDGGNTFNISTTVVFVAAACGARIAKHGNRAMSGASGSSDVLEALGLRLALSPERVGELIEEIGIGFMFAPNHHAAMKHAAPVRRELGVRTLFNLLGPLTNPAGIQRQVIGIFSPDLLLPYAEALIALKTAHALVVHGNGLDEISISGSTDIAEVKNGAIMRYTLAPEDVGLRRAPLSAIQVQSVEDSKEMLTAVLNGTMGAARDVVLLNTAAALIVAGLANNFGDGVAMAAMAINAGRAKKKLEAFIAAAGA